MIMMNQRATFCSAACVLALVFGVGAGIAVDQTGSTAKAIASGSLMDRLAAASRLQRSGVTVGDAMIAAAIAGLLEDANDFISSSYLAGTGVADEFSEAYSDVLDLGLALVPRSNAALRSRLLGALVRGAYNPTSPFAHALAVYGDEVTPHAIALSSSVIEPNRWNSYALLGDLLARDGEARAGARLSAPHRAAAKQALLGGLSERSHPSLYFAVHAVAAGNVREGAASLRAIEQRLAAAPTNRADRGAALLAFEVHAAISKVGGSVVK